MDFLAWAKEYGDVLGTVGFLFAMLTVLVTNGKVILQRFRGDPLGSFPSGSPISPGAITVPATSGKLTPVQSVKPDYGDKIAVAVLPPKEMGVFDDHFADGLADDLIADLQQALFATPEVSTVARMVKEGADTATIAHSLGLKHVLSTSIRRQENKIRVTAQLIDPAGVVVWSDRYNADDNDLMTVQQSVAENITEEITALLIPAAGIRDPASGKPYASRAEAMVAISSPKSRFIALLLCLPPLGILGIHRFYVGRPFTGLLYIPTAGLVIFGWLIDTILIALGMFADGKGRPLRIWRHDPLKRLNKS